MAQVTFLIGQYQGRAKFHFQILFIGSGPCQAAPREKTVSKNLKGSHGWNQQAVFFFCWLSDEKKPFEAAPSLTLLTHINKQEYPWLDKQETAEEVFDGDVKVWNKFLLEFIKSW